MFDTRFATRERMTLSQGDKAKPTRSVLKQVKIMNFKSGNKVVAINFSTARYETVFFFKHKSFQGLLCLKGLYDF